MQWMVVLTRPRAEQRVASRLSNDLSVFLPLQKRVTEKRVTESAYFPGYMFVEARRSAVRAIKDIDGVSCILGDMNGPTAISSESIQPLVERADDHGVVEVVDLRPHMIRVGDKVKVVRENSPLDGKIAKVLKKLSRGELLVEIEFFGSVRSARIPRRHLTALLAP